MKLLEYHLDDRLTAFSTTRHGGVSEGAYATFNANAYCGDDEAHVAANRRLLAEHLGIAIPQLVFTHQVHNTVVRKVDEAFMQLSPDERQAQTEGTDALMTDLPGVCLCISTADCVPVVIYDPVHRAVSCVHAGWRGTVKRICQAALEEMALAYSTRACDCKAVIGPSISLQCFEVGNEVYDEFRAAGFDMNAIAHRYASSLWKPQVPDVPVTHGDDKWHIDLWECNRLQLLDSGLTADAILVSGICTYTHSDDFFSARGLGMNSGRILTGAMIK